MLRDHVQRCPLILVNGGDAGAIFDEQLGHPHVPFPRGHMQRCLPLLASGGDVGTLLDEQPDHRFMSEMGCYM